MPSRVLLRPDPFSQLPRCAVDSATVTARARAQRAAATAGARPRRWRWGDLGGGIVRIRSYGQRDAVLLREDPQRVVHVLAEATPFHVHAGNVGEKLPDVDLLGDALDVASLHHQQLLSPLQEQAVPQHRQQRVCTLAVHPRPIW
jgi:hypothetical protein